eukprot:11059586-Lingulodinium_polyedra.AAC.1
MAARYKPCPGIPGLGRNRQQIPADRGSGRQTPCGRKLRTTRYLTQSLLAAHVAPARCNPERPDRA